MPVNPLMQYDMGIYQRVKSLYDETFFASPDECFKVNAKQHKGKVLMPFISIWRLGDFSISRELFNDPFVREGFLNATRGNAEFSNQRVAMHGLPVSLQYQIDVYATRRDVCDGLASELLMDFMEHPHFVAKIQDMGDQKGKVEFNFDVDDSVVDNSSISDFNETNRFYHLTLTGNVPSAVIFRVDTFDTVEKVEIDMDYKEKNDDEGSYEIDVNTPSQQAPIGWEKEVIKSGKTT